MTEKNKNKNKNVGRKHFNIPHPLLDQVEEYQRNYGHTTTTSAFLELVRIGLRTVKEKEKEQS